MNAKGTTLKKISILFIVYFCWDKIQIILLLFKCTLCICVYISPTPPPQVGCDTRSISKLSKASLNLVFFFPGLVA